MEFSPRFDRRLERRLRRIRDIDRPIAEIWRELGEGASALGCPRPGYGSVRVRVHSERRRRAELRAALDTAADLDLRAAAPTVEGVQRAYRRNLARRLGEMPRDAS